MKAAFVLSANIFKSLITRCEHAESRGIDVFERAPERHAHYVERHIALWSSVVRRGDHAMRMAHLGKLLGPDFHVLKFCGVAENIEGVVVADSRGAHVHTVEGLDARAANVKVRRGPSQIRGR